MVYLTNRLQFVSINGVNSRELIMQFVVPQVLVRGPLLLLICINDLHTSIKFCNTRHRAGDTNLLIVNKSLKQIYAFFQNGYVQITFLLVAVKQN